MTSVQERLQLKRMALDNWSIKEKLCLASAVSCSGDQNWMSVSRSLKMLCGSNRPADWFSQKSCAVQYGELLENVETPKRKKRTVSERDSSITETPTESILRKLTQERISELKSQIQKDQEEYAKLREEILLAQNANVTEAQLKDMWAQIEQEQEQKVAEQQKYSQWLKEREERKTELQRAWRPGTFSQAQSQTQQGQKSHSQTSIKQEEMEVDDTTNTKHGTAPLLTSLLKSPSPAPSSTTTATTVHSSTSSVASTGVRIVAPTITNLLTGNTTNQIISTSVTTPVTSNQQQYHPIQSKPLTGPSPTEHPQQITPSPSQAAPTLSMLLENKNKEEQTSNQIAAAAATISVTTTAPAAAPEEEETVIEEDEGEGKVDQTEAMETEDGENSTNKDDHQQLMEVFNRLIPDNIIIDELEDILTNNNAIILNPDLLEEESILEDVNSLIDDEQDDVNDNKAAMANTTANVSTSNNEAMQEKQQTENSDSKNLSDSSDSTKVKEEIKEENVTKLDPKNIPKIEDSSGGGTVKSEPENKEIPEIKNDIKNELKNETAKEESSKQTDTKPFELKEEKIEETVQKIDSSDDSSDNTTLQILKEKINVDIKTTESNDANESSVENVLMEITTAAVAGNEETTDFPINEEKSETKVNRPEPMDSEISECKETENAAEIKKPLIDTEIIIIGEDSDSNDAKPEVEKQEIKKASPPRKSESPVKISKQEIERSKSPEKQPTSKQSGTSEKSSSLAAAIHSMTPKELKVVVEATPLLSELTTTITIIDTDEESPIEVTKDEKFNKNKRDYSRTRKSEVHIDKKAEESATGDESKHNLSIRKLKERDGSESPLVDDENMDTVPRTRRRYSSTPVIDSIPSSPASSDDREYKAWKKSILMIYNRIATHRHASLFLRPVTEDMAPNYKTIVLRPMDLHTIKKNIENGVIRTTTEFQRDVMLMCQNAIMYNKKDNNVYSMAKEMMTESVAVIESLIENVKRDSEKIQSSSAVKGRSRKSHRLP